MEAREIKLYPYKTEEMALPLLVVKDPYPFLDGRKKYYFHGQYGNFFLR